MHTKHNITNLKESSAYKNHVTNNSENKVGSEHKELMKALKSQIQQI